VSIYTEEPAIRTVGSEQPISLGVPDQEDDLSLPAHIVNPDMNAELWNYLGLNSHEINAGTKLLVDYARMTGSELVALCGHRWVPTQVANTHEVCQPCMEVAQILIGEDGS